MTRAYAFRELPLKGGGRVGSRLLYVAMWWRNVQSHGGLEKGARLMSGDMGRLARLQGESREEFREGGTGIF